MYPYCFFNGKITKSNIPLIKLNDISILRGFAAFDFMRVYNGKPFMFKKHMTRFKHTCSLMGLKNKFSDTQIQGVLNELIKKNKQKNYQVRFVLTGGEVQNGIEPGNPIFYILFEKISDLPTNLYTNGAKIITHHYQRNLPEAKNSNYMQAVLLQKKKKKEKAIEILYVYDNSILEASTSNIFIIKNNDIYTTKDNILKGITRQLVIDIAKKMKYQVFEKEILIKELLDADEVFLTATNKKVLPITQIDSHTIQNGLVGDITREFLQEYNKLIM